MLRIVEEICSDSMRATDVSNGMITASDVPNRRAAYAVVLSVVMRIKGARQNSQRSIAGSHEMHETLSARLSATVCIVYALPWRSSSGRVVMAYPIKECTFEPKRFKKNSILLR